jgi:hypothetical protein
MAELARLRTGPQARPTPARRAPLFADHLQDEAAPPTASRRTWPRWLSRLASLAFIAAALGPLLFILLRNW